MDTSAKFSINNHRQAIYHTDYPKSECVIVHGKCTVNEHWFIIGNEFDFSTVREENSIDTSEKCSDNNHCDIVHGKCTVGEHWILIVGEFPILSMLLWTIGFLCGSGLMWLATKL